MDANTKVAIIGFSVMCILLGANTYANFTVADKATKAQTVGQIVVDADECQSRCPVYQSGHIDNATGKWVDSNNTEHDRCKADCEGQEKAKLKALVSGK